MLRGWVVLAMLLTQAVWARPPLSVCAEDQWPPFSFIQANRPAGASLDLVAAAFAAAGWQVQFESGSYTRCMQLVRDGHFDALVDVAQNDERKPQLLWPKQALLILELHLVSSQPRGNAPLGFEAMQHKRVGITLGYEYPNRMLSQPDIHLVESPSELGNFHHLARGDLDFMLLSRGTLATLRDKLTKEERRHIYDWGQIDELPLYLAFSLHTAEGQQAAEAFDQGITTLRKSGRAQQVMDRWKAVP